MQCKLLLALDKYPFISVAYHRPIWLRHAIITVYWMTYLVYEMGGRMQHVHPGIKRLIWKKKSLTNLLEVYYFFQFLSIYIYIFYDMLSFLKNKITCILIIAFFQYFLSCLFFFNSLKCDIFSNRNLNL